MSTEKNVKPRLRITEWSFVPRPFFGSRCLHGVLLDDHHTSSRLRVGSLMWSSRIVSEDLDAGLVETDNTLYELVGPERKEGDGP